MMYDIILVEKPYEEGIQSDELALIFAYLKNDFEYYPISIEVDSSYAYGTCDRTHSPKRRGFPKAV